MLVLNRRLNEKIIFGNLDFVLRVYEFGVGRCSISVTASKRTDFYVLEKEQCIHFSEGVDDVVVLLIRKKRGEVKLAICAPESMKVWREEIFLRKEQEKLTGQN